ncbi:serine/threonine-protein kinase [Pseudomonas sp. MAFF212428]|uniref:Serine/threonine-protein kinase n=1 Tax=Pseudomonas brassicae TaxID=2708063 RepID=A0A6B3NXK9_9PSED|nr:leucine-rich repeat-containing protein kinase family protein [Pseudomonas brassicae]NER59104.1 serine/threonine-protein kinase [Pseudomonas brassicae]NER64367.1 serine/threonine-protein kinase [Pseudomonas brassicae]
MHTLDDLKAGRLAGTARLDLSCGLEHFPPEIFDLADSLEVLNLSDNALQCLPADMGRLHRLKILFCSNNRFTEVPASVGQCTQLQMLGFKSNRIAHLPGEALGPRLRALVLTDNCLQALPDALGDCSHLQKLMLAGNQLRTLPASLARCERLELLRISANQLRELPAWLLAMPNLAWLAYAGNPLPAGYRTPGAPGACARIDWPAVVLGEVLGQGASGIIHRAQVAAQDVAVKLYKGQMTSDGSPLNEMSACIAAGKHPHLVELLARIDNHPQHLPGLVMALVDPHWFNLAAPPSLASCTRDCYPAAQRLDSAQMLRLLAAIASVAAHLHARGLAHGDLYAHNILCDEQGNGLLGDFGAASFYPQDGSQTAAALQRIEVRAFGVLLGELLARCEQRPPAWEALQARCVQPQVLERPDFAQIEQALAG